MSYDKKYMQRAIELARKGVGAVNPNPLVGAVIVKNDEIIGEGYHTKYGDLHAEREAFKDAAEKGNDVSGAEMYVTLEPCSHTGKQPPCTEAIIESGVKRVYVGSDDPNPQVAGSGIWNLRMAGIEVITHCMKEECDELNPVFFHFITKKTPYLVYKYAMTLDGKTCTCTSKSKWISNEHSRSLVQDFRNEFSAIMVGIGTVLKDDPSLACHKEGGRNPIRIICDSDLRIPITSQIVSSADNIKTYIVSLSENEKKNREKIRILKDKGIGTLLIPADENGSIDLSRLMIQLGKMNIDSILLEGGGKLAWSVFEAGYVDEIRCFLAPKVFGGSMAGTPVGGPGVDEPSDSARFDLVEMKNLDGDIYLRYLRSSVDYNDN